MKNKSWNQIGWVIVKQNHVPFWRGGRKGWVRLGLFGHIDKRVLGRSRVFWGWWIIRMNLFHQRHPDRTLFGFLLFWHFFRARTGAFSFFTRWFVSIGGQFFRCSKNFKVFEISRFLKIFWNFKIFKLSIILSLLWFTLRTADIFWRGDLFWHWYYIV